MHAINCSVETKEARTHMTKDKCKSKTHEVKARTSEAKARTHEEMQS